MQYWNTSKSSGEIKWEFVRNFIIQVVVLIMLLTQIVLLRFENNLIKTLKAFKGQFIFCMLILKVLLSFRFFFSLLLCLSEHLSFNANERLRKIYLLLICDEARLSPQWFGSRLWIWRECFDSLQCISCW